VPDWDNTESRESDEDAAWRDLVARFDAPAMAEQPVPWPEREDMSPARETRETRETQGSREVEETGSVRGARGAQTDPRQASEDLPTGEADGTRAEPDDEHFIPPAPPPLPRLDPVTKGAWAALFGGPAYLVVATAVGWSVPALAAFCAVAAFVAGFVILVLRMHGPDSDGSEDGGDDGAVV
jgi:hypothetical protein